MTAKNLMCNEKFGINCASAEAQFGIGRGITTNHGLNLKFQKERKMVIELLSLPPRLMHVLFVFLQFPVVAIVLAADVASVLALGLCGNAHHQNTFRRSWL